MIPKNLTHAEVGALLHVVGQRMMDHDVAAEVVLDLSSYSDPDETLGELVAELRDAYWQTSLAPDRAEEILGLTLAEAIEFNEADK